MKVAILLVPAFLFIAMKDGQLKNYHGTNEVVADSLLKKMLDKLNSFKNIRYSLKRELNYLSENYHNETSWTVYYDFESNDTILSAKYLIDDEVLKQVFNGTEKFDMNKQSKTIQVNDAPNQESFSSSSAFYNSIFTLKNVLPRISNDKTIAKKVSDTTVNNIPCYLITLNLSKRRIKNLGNGFDEMRTKNNFIYKIVVDKNNELPLEVLQVNDLNNDFIKTSFTNISTSNPAVAELSWYYSTYAGEYKPVAQRDLPQLISVGSYAPQWTLPLYNNEENVALNNLKGKVVLLDFWIKNCGPCVKSIPFLNALTKKYSNKKFEILGINSYDAKKDISWFCEKHKPDYRILMQGKVVAEKYGVSGFPTVILIDKEGKVLYAGSGIDETKMEKMIQSVL